MEKRKKSQTYLMFLISLILSFQLIQARRTAEAEWEVKNILPVSFATLAVPLKDNPPDFIDLRKYLHEQSSTVNPLYNDNVCSKLL